MKKSAKFIAFVIIVAIVVIATLILWGVIENIAK
jgi:hypothetical protein